MIDPNSIIDAGKVVDDYIAELKKKISDLEAQLLQQNAQLEKCDDDICFLECLRAAGVDNWEGYDEALRMMNDGED
jgi:hypothetical protein